ncbi:MAG TPA: Rieske 2Fe-2S domain-containing protein [Acidimicrobiales bacterium]|nr:Rieske 2Fe-2S domain-containing protein [Acidimicrobiales bacterium]
MASTDGAGGTSVPSGGPVGPPPLVETWHTAALAWLEARPRLVDLDRWVHRALAPLHARYRDRPVVEALHGGRWFGHALHPALSDLPVGLWTGAFLVDLVGGGDEAAARLSGAGLVAAVTTVATGVSDWLVSDGGDRRLGLVHGLATTAGTGLQAASLVCRRAGRRGLARTLGMASLGVTVGAAYLGGHLVLGRGLMVNHTAWHVGPRRWVRAVRDEELAPGAPAGVVVEGRQVLLCRLGEQVLALDDVCSHAGGLLSRGRVAGASVTCPLHGSVFDLGNGRVLRGPACYPQPCLPVRLRNGWVEVRASRPARRAGTGQEGG